MVRIQTASAATWKPRLLAALAVLLAVASTGKAVGAGPDAEEASRRRALRRTPVVEAYERVRDSVANISVTERVERYGRTWFGELVQLPAGQRQSVGSGFVIHEAGYIATNAHVVSAGAQLTVTFADGHGYEAHIIGRDVERDLAVIKIDAEGPLVPVPLGRDDDLMIGEQTIAVGNPRGLENTVTTGVVSALHREVVVDGQMVYRDAIQTDASINPGNSGGPLLNVLGEVIGINTAVRSDAQNIGFAIPVEQLRDVLPDVLELEKVKEVQVGLKVSAADPPRVIEVRSDSPAAEAGVALGDVVRAIDGSKVNRGMDVYAALLEREAGEDVALELERSGKRVKAELKLSPLPEPDGAELAWKRLGLRIEDTNGKLAEQLASIGGRGVVVMGVQPASPAHRAGIEPGDVVVYLGRYRLKDVKQLGLLLRGVAPGDPVDVSFYRLTRRRILEGEARLYAR